MKYASRHLAPLAVAAVFIPAPPLPAAAAGRPAALVRGIGAGECRLVMFEPAK